MSNSGLKAELDRLRKDPAASDDAIFYGFFLTRNTAAKCVLWTACVCMVYGFIGFGRLLYEFDNMLFQIYNLMSTADVFVFFGTMHVGLALGTAIGYSIYLQEKELRDTQVVTVLRGLRAIILVGAVTGLVAFGIAYFSMPLPEYIGAFNDMDFLMITTLLSSTLSIGIIAGYKARFYELRNQYP